MGLIIELERVPYTTREEEIRSRTFFGLEALAIYLNGNFRPSRMDVWERAADTAFEGIKLQSVDFTNESVDLSSLRTYIERASNNFEDARDKIFRFEGNWVLDNNKPVGGFFSINNALQWRSTYGDIEAEIYPTQEAEDLTDLLWSSSQIRKENVDDFFETYFKRVRNPTTMEKLKWIAFGHGVPSRGDLSNLLASYYGKESSLVFDMFTTFRQYNGWSQTHLEPYKQQFVVARAYDTEEFRRGISESISRFKVTRKEGNSVTFIGEKKDSFRNLYNKISTEFVEPVVKTLSEAQRLDQQIKYAIRKQTKLFGET